MGGGINSSEAILWVMLKFDWLSWQLNAKFAVKSSKIDSSEAILWVKLKLCRTVYSVSLYKIIVCFVVVVVVVVVFVLFFLFVTCILWLLWQLKVSIDL